jgi:pimeloyl-ACP methyl ester carboxylesterase
MSRAYKLAVFEEGKGRPVILLHGMVSTHRYWQDIVERLAGKRRLIMPDMLGFGASPKPRKATYDIDELIASLERTLKNYRFKQPPVLVGHSMGAVVALRWAREKPEKFSGLVLSSPTFFQKNLFHQQLASIAVEGHLLANKLLAKSITTLMGLAGLIPSPLATRIARSWPKHVIQDATRHRYYVYKKIVKNALYMEDVLDDLKAVTIPTHILLGEGDLVARHALSQVRSICRKSKQCHLHVLSGGHQIPLEHPETVAKIIASVA